MDRPSREHTELEEELHETAHIDYDRVAIVRHLSLLRHITVHYLPLLGCQSFRLCPL